MSFETPVTDRTQNDINTLTSKAYFNRTDWNRIYMNIWLTNSLFYVVESGIAFDIINEVPSFTTIPSVATFNLMLGNIERMRLYMETEYSHPNFIGYDIKDDWVAGINEVAPDFEDVNLWELTTLRLWSYALSLWPDPLDDCPTLSSNLTITTSQTVIYIDCLDMSTHDLTIEGNGKLYIFGGTTYG